MEKKTNVYDRARGVVQELQPLLHAIREEDKSLADQLKRAAQSVVLNIAEARGNDAGNARARFSTACAAPRKEVRAALNVATDWGYIEPRTWRPTWTRSSTRCAPSRGAWAEGSSGPRASRTSRRLHRERCPPLGPGCWGRTRRPPQAEGPHAPPWPSHTPMRTAHSCRPRVVPIRLGDIEDDAIHRAMDLVEERSDPACERLEAPAAARPTA